MTTAGNMLMLSGGKKWRNPYVTDGLVAMYDGEWNEAPGIHSTERVCNNIVADMWHGNVGARVVIGDNYFQFDGVKTSGASIGLGYDWFGKPDHMSFEVCFVSLDAGSQTNQSPFGGTEVSTSGATFFNNKVQVRINRSGSVAREDINYSNWIGSQEIHTYTLSVGAAAVFSARDGNYYGDSPQRAGAAMDWASRLEQCYIGSDAWNGPEYVLNGRVYCVRVYARSIDLATAAANYAVDVARFNLPTA